MKQDEYVDDDLHLAAQQGDLELVDSLLAKGANINAFDELGKTPLHYAVQEERFDVVERLLKAGADVNAHHEPTIGNTPLADVAGHCSLAMAKRLVDAGADPTIAGWMQLTALDRAEDRKRPEGQKVHELLLNAARSRRR